MAKMKPMQYTLNMDSIIIDTYPDFLKQGEKGMMAFLLFIHIQHISKKQNTDMNEFKKQLNISEEELEDIKEIYIDTVKLQYDTSSNEIRRI